MKLEFEDRSYPLFAKISVPRMIVIQYDSILSNLLADYQKRFLQLFQKLLENKKKKIFTIYLCAFVLCREASFITQDRYRHARQNHGSKV